MLGWYGFSLCYIKYLLLLFFLQWPSIWVHLAHEECYIKYITLYSVQNFVLASVRFMTHDFMLEKLFNTPLGSSVVD
jgi:hypothetical protein